jgi:hypothetical protein
VAKDSGYYYFTDENQVMAEFHDECIFKQYLMTNKSWKGPNSETTLAPKDDGTGLMTSAFQSHEFCFGTPLTE